MPPQKLALALALFAGSGNAAGGLLVALSLPGRGIASRSGRALAALTQVGAGILVAVALLESVPTTLDTMRPRIWAAPLILLGYLLVHMVEYTIVPHLLGKSEKSQIQQPKPQIQQPQAQQSSTPYTFVMALIVHSFFDGVAVGAAALLSTTFGGLVFAAILMHKFPVRCRAVCRHGFFGPQSGAAIKPFKNKMRKIMTMKFERHHAAIFLPLLALNAGAVGGCHDQKQQAACMQWTKSDTIRFSTGFGVLRGSPVPSVLIECGYISNATDLRHLQNDEVQQSIASGITAGMRDFIADQKAFISSGSHD